MAYPTYAAAPGYVTPPRKKRGLKRIIFGILGLVANAIGLIVWPLLMGIVGAIFFASSFMNPQPLPASGSFELSAMHMGVVYVPSDVAGTADCTVTAPSPAEIVDATEKSTVTVDGTSYTGIKNVTSTEATSVSVTCTGTDQVLYATGDISPVLIWSGVGIVIPIVLGLVALALLIWGIIARVRS